MERRPVVCVVLFIFLITKIFCVQGEALVDARTFNSHIRVSVPSRCFVRKAVAKKLDLVQRELEPLKLGLKVLAGYRPLDAQKKLWKKCPNSRYVANPANGSRHNRGAAVDIRLVRLSDGYTLQMPSKLSHFSSKCHRCYERMPSEEIRKNCKLLELVMEKYGFIPLPTEWWHFDDGNWVNYEVLNIPFSVLEKRERKKSFKKKKKNYENIEKECEDSSEGICEDDSTNTSTGYTENIYAMSKKEDCEKVSEKISEKVSKKIKKRSICKMTPIKNAYVKNVRKCGNKRGVESIRATRKNKRKLVRGVRKDL
jgi:D-alanyl-D-alanine dipeptidase